MRCVTHGLVVRATGTRGWGEELYTYVGQHRLSELAPQSFLNLLSLPLGTKQVEHLKGIEPMEEDANPPPHHRLPGPLQLWATHQVNDKKSGHHD